MARDEDLPVTVGELVARLQRCDPQRRVNTLFLAGPSVAVGGVHVIEDHGQVYLRYTKAGGGGGG